MEEKGISLSDKLRCDGLVCKRKNTWNNKY